MRDLEGTLVDVRISVIVPCYNVEEFVEQCLNSVITQYCEGLEIVVIDDASTDGTWKLVKKYDGLPFLRLVKLDENIGLGAARNKGIELARGEYLLFLDSDDWLVGGALNELIRCSQENSPDLVFFNYARVYQKAGAYSGPHDELFKRVPKCVARDEEKIILLDFPTMAWFKLYKREFVIRSGLRFGKGYYEDVNWSYSLTILANTIEMLPVVLYCYRQRSGSILNNKSDRHLELISEYETLFEQCSKLKEDCYSHKVAAKALEHYEVILFVRSARLSWPGLRKFFLKAHEQISKLEPKAFNYAIDSSTGWGSALRQRVLVSGSFYLYVCVFALFKTSRLFTRPIDLYRAYFSNRRIDV